MCCFFFVMRRPPPSSTRTDPPFPSTPRFRSSMPSAVAKPLFRRPCAADGDGWNIAERIVLGGRLPIDGVADMAALGEALHAVLAYDHPERPIETRSEEHTSELQ